MQGRIVPNPKKGSFYSEAVTGADSAAIVPNPKKGSFYSLYFPRAIAYRIVPNPKKGSFYSPRPKPGTSGMSGLLAMLA